MAFASNAQLIVKNAVEKYVWNVIQATTWIKKQRHASYATKLWSIVRVAQAQHHAPNVSTVISSVLIQLWINVHVQV